MYKNEFLLSLCAYFGWFVYEGREDECTVYEECMYGGSYNSSESVGRLGCKGIAMNGSIRRWIYEAVRTPILDGPSQKTTPMKTLH